MSRTSHAISRLPDHSGALLLAGVVGVTAYNWWRWRRDSALAERLVRTRRSPSPLSRTPRISVLVAAWNERDYIDAHIRSFLDLRYPEIELIVCAGGDDGTLDRARTHASERVIVLEQQAGEGKQRALARCLARASGDIVYLTDADCLYTDAALLRLIAPLVEDAEQAATGSVRPLDTQRGKLLPSYLEAVHIAASARAPRYVESLRGANTAMWRSVLEGTGGLDFSAPIGTDYHLALRLLSTGVKIRHAPRSIVPTRYPETVGAYVRGQSRWLRNVLVHAPRHRARRDLLSASRTVAVGTLLAVAAVPAVVCGGLPLVSWSLLFAHATMAKVRYVLFAARLRREKPSPQLLGTLPLLTLLDFVTWTMPALELLRFNKRYRW